MSPGAKRTTPGPASASLLGNSGQIRSTVIRVKSRQAGRGCWERLLALEGRLVLRPAGLCPTGEQNTAIQQRSVVLHQQLGLISTFS